MGGSIRWVYLVGGLYGRESIRCTVGYTVFLPFGYLGINYPSALGDPEKRLTHSNLL